MACTWYYRVSHCTHTYIYICVCVCVCVCLCMQHRLCARVYITIYAYMQGIYAYIEHCKHIYRSYIYILHVFLFVFIHYICCICANGCNFVQMHASLHINAPPNEESRTQLCAAKLTYIYVTKRD